MESLRLVPPGWYCAILFAAFVAEGTSFPLLHVPAIVMFLVSAYVVAAGKISLVTVIIVAALGSATGGFITYLLGTRLTTPEGKARPLKFFTKPERLAQVQGFIARHGALFALTARWLGVLRPAALLGTGMAKVNPWKVVPALLVGSLVYCAVYQLVAEGLGAVSLRLLGEVSLKWILLSALGLALAWAGGLFLLRRIRL